MSAAADSAETRLNRLLNLILETAVDVLGFDAATITTRHNPDGLATIGATDQRMVALDDSQYASREGPCLAVLDQHTPVYIKDASIDDPRWQYFNRTAAHLGVISTLSVHVPTGLVDVAASLNLYSKRQLEPSDQQLRTAAGYAEQIAATIHGVEDYKATASLAQQMAQALQSRAVIEQAKGILIADHHITPDQAFDKLTQLSQHTNTKLRDVAQDIVQRRSTAAPERDPVSD